MQTVIAQNLRADPVIAQVGLEPQVLVGLNRIHAPVLKLVGVDLVGQANPAPFLAHIQNDSPTLLRDHRHRPVELVPAVTS